MANCSISSDQLVIKLVFLSLVALLETILLLLKQKQTQTIACFRPEIWRLKLLFKSLIYAVKLSGIFCRIFNLILYNLY